MKISNLSKNYNAKKVVNSVNLEIKKIRFPPSLVLMELVNQPLWV